MKLAEREGFEPSVPVTQYARLAIWCLRPLGHLSAQESVEWSESRRLKISGSRGSRKIPSTLIRGHFVSGMDEAREFYRTIKSSVNWLGFRR